MRYLQLLIVFIAVINSLPLVVIAQKKKSAQHIDSGYAHVNGTRLYYEIAGMGKSLVFIHGSFGDRMHWDLQFGPLSKKYKVIRYDVRGYGKSAVPVADEPYRDSDDLNALMDFLGIKKAYICGLSMGSVIGVDFVLSHPDKSSALIAIGPRVSGDGSAEYKTPMSDSVSAAVANAVELVRNNGPREGTDYLWTGNNPLSKSVVSSQTRQALLHMGYEYSWWRYLNANKREQVFPTAIKQLREIKIPALIITAEYDLELCKQVAAVMVKEIHAAKLVSIKGAGHIMNMDKPKDFNKIISNFIDRN